MQKLVNGIWTDTIEADLVVGEQYRISVGGGWEQKAYSLPVVEPVIAIRKITKRSFMRRFTQPERTLILKSADDIVVDIYEDLKSVNNVDLDMADTISALAYLESVAILTTGRPAAILVDGTASEV